MNTNYPHVKADKKFSSGEKFGPAERNLFFPVATRYGVSATQACVLIWTFIFIKKISSIQMIAEQMAAFE